MFLSINVAFEGIINNLKIRCKIIFKDNIFTVFISSSVQIILNLCQS